MSHPFGDLVSQHLHRKHGLSQSKLAEGILQDPSIIGKMCKGQRLNGPQARERICAIIDWLCQQAVLTTVDEANQLLTAADMIPLRAADPVESRLLHQLSTLTPSFTLPPLPQTPVTTRPRTNLPAALTSFIGRAEAVAEVAHLVLSHRLVTLTGSGGVGKTRLAVETARTLVAEPPASALFPDGVWFVDLVPLTSAEAIPQRILDLWRVPEQSESTPLSTLLAYLSNKQTLLILDNCEHLIDACAELAEALLQQCPQLSLLTTSREALNLPAELAWRVPSLTRPRANPDWSDPAAPSPAPLSPEALLRFEAVALFVERARSRQPAFALTAANAPAVAQICSRLDGIPLALEMAAARVHVFTIEEMATRLDGALDARFQLLTGGARTAPLRHQTLLATLEWSYSLLMPVEQQLLLRLSVFNGGWTAAAAMAVTGCTLDLLVQLVNKSLVIADQQGGQTRYRLLETVRQFAAEQIMADAQAQRQIQRQHSAYYLHLLGEQEARLQSQQQPKAMEIIRADFANISTAWQWAVEQGEFTLLAPAIHALFLYCDVRGSVSEGLRLFTNAAANLGEHLTAASGGGPGSVSEQTGLHSLWVRLRLHVGVCEVTLGNYPDGAQKIQEALPLITRDRDHILALEYLVMAAAHQGELPLAHTYLSESLAISQAANDWAGMAMSLHRLIKGNSDYPEVCRLCAESLALWRKVGRPDRIADVTIDLGWYSWCIGDYTAASAYLREGLALCEAMDFPIQRAWAVNSLGYVAWSVGELAAAEQMHREALSLYAVLGHPSEVGMCKADLSLVLTDAERVPEAISVAQEAVAIMRAINNQMMLTVSLNWLSVAYLAAGNLAAARDTLVEVIGRAWQHRYLFTLMIAFYYVAELSALEFYPSLPDEPVQQALLITVLSFIRTQKATWQFFKDKAAKLQAKLEERLPADLHAAAIARSHTITVEEMVGEMLGAVGAGSSPS